MKDTDRQLGETEQHQEVSARLPYEPPRIVESGSFDNVVLDCGFDGSCTGFPASGSPPSS